MYTKLDHAFKVCTQNLTTYLKHASQRTYAHSQGLNKIQIS